MYSVNLSKVSNSRHLIPTCYVNQVFVQFETYAKTVKLEESRTSNFETEKLIHINHPPGLALPLGIKRSSFLPKKSASIKQKKMSNSIKENSSLCQFNSNEIRIVECVSNHLQSLDHKSSLIEYESNIIQCSNANQNQNSKKLKGPNLELVAYQLTQDLGSFFTGRQDWSMYHKELVLQDNVRGVQVVGLEKYLVLVNLLRMLAHIRFVYVRMTLLSLSKHPEESTIRVRWRVVGLGLGRMVLRYFPDKLWEKGNMERMSPSYFDGYSTFYVDSNSKIYQHTVDKVMEDKDKEVVKSVSQRWRELKQRVATQPAL